MSPLEKYKAMEAEYLELGVYSKDILYEKDRLNALYMEGLVGPVGRQQDKLDREFYKVQARRKKLEDAMFKLRTKHGLFV